MLRDLRVRDDAWARMDPAHCGAHQRLWIDVVRRAQPGYVAASAALLALAAWQPGHGAMQARRPAMGSDSTISRSGHQGPPLPDTDLAQAAGSNFLTDGSRWQPRLDIAVGDSVAWWAQRGPCLCKAVRPG